MKRFTGSWTKIRCLRHILIQYLLSQNRFGTSEVETIEKKEDVRCHAAGIPMLTDLLILAMKTNALVLIRGATEFLTVKYGPGVTFALPAVTFLR